MADAHDSSEVLGVGEGYAMRDAIVRQLLQLNRDFYATVAADFDQTRGGLPLGWRQLRDWLPPVSGQPLRVLDVGCGNGRFAWLLDEWGIQADYIGIDGDTNLLALARAHAASLNGVRAQFYGADFTAPDWPAAHGRTQPDFDVVVCFAALHHVPSHKLRVQVVRSLAAQVIPTGVLILSHWQFLSSARFVRKQIAWQTIGLTESDVEAGDALLPWQQGTYAVRYVHQVDPAEGEALAAAAQMHITNHFYADGKEGNLNLYQCLCAVDGENHDNS